MAVVAPVDDHQRDDPQGRQEDHGQQGVDLHSVSSSLGLRNDRRTPAPLLRTAVEHRRVKAQVYALRHGQGVIKQTAPQRVHPFTRRRGQGRRAIEELVPSLTCVHLHVQNHGPKIVHAQALQHVYSAMQKLIAHACEHPFEFPATPAAT